MFIISLLSSLILSSIYKVEKGNMFSLYIPYYLRKWRGGEVYLREALMFDIVAFSGHLLGEAFLLECELILGNTAVIAKM